jgi:hypothetical protein
MDDYVHWSPRRFMATKISLHNEILISTLYGVKLLALVVTINLYQLTLTIQNRMK